MQLTIQTVLNATAALAIVLGLVLLAARAARTVGLSRRAPARGPRRLTLQDTLALDRSRAIHIVRCDGRELLLLTGTGVDTPLGWLPPHTALDGDRP